ALGVPLVLEVNGYAPADTQEWYRSLAEPIGASVERRKLARADLVVTTSESLGARLIAQGVLRERLVVVPHGVPEERLTAPRPRGKPPVVGWIGHALSWH